MPFGTLSIFSRGKQVATGVTDINGEAIIKGLAAGRYTVHAAFVGYQSAEMVDVLLLREKTTAISMKISSSGSLDLQDVVVIEYKTPLIAGDVSSS